MANILLVDDELRILNLLSLYLTEMGHICEKETSGLKAIERLKEGSFDLIFLDVMMPELDGWQTTKVIREFSSVPIIMLTARGDQDDIVFGLKNGADDYITKPFNEEVLLARTEALLRRSGNTELLEFKNLQLDYKRTQVRIGSVPVLLTAREFSLLHLFLENQNYTFSREHLIEKVWGYTSEIDSRTIDSHLRNLRKKLNEHGFPVENYLKSVYSVGYQWKSL